MMDPISESKKLAIELKEKEEYYVTGQLDLNETLDATDRLWKERVKAKEESSITANEIMPDSHLVKLQSGLAKQRAKIFKPDSLVFNPTEFSIKLKLHFDQSSVSQSDIESTQKGNELLWLYLGAEAKKLLFNVPSFNYIHGTFDPDPVEQVKKKRKMREKDKLGALTQPQSMSLKESSENKDTMIERAQKVLYILKKLLSKQEENEGVCFYEFVTDPASYGRTVENIFILSLLVNQHCVKIVRDINDLPFLLLVGDNERKERTVASPKQCLLSISYQDWKNIVETFKFKKAVIPPRLLHKT